MSSFYSRSAEVLAHRYEEVPTERVHRTWLHLFPHTKANVLDVGAGSGRDASFFARQGHEVVAVEPCPEFREIGPRLHREAGITWVDDALPALKAVHSLNVRFDVILLSAVWMHVSPTSRERAFRKLLGLLKPGGLLVITLRQGPAHDERAMYPVSTGELLRFATQFAAEVVVQAKQPDEMGRPDVDWEIVVCRVPDDGTGALPLLRHIIINDPKSSTYKLALLRILLRIADGSPGIVLEKTDDYVSLPFGLVALYWVKTFKSLVLDNGFSQQPTGSGNLGFDRAAFRALKDLSSNDLRIGCRFEGETARNLAMAIRDARNTIKKMPAFHTKYPGSSEPVFPCGVTVARVGNSLALDQESLAAYGVFQVPRHLWDAMTSYACWIEPAIVSEWAKLMAGYDERAGKKRPLDQYYDGLKWLDDHRNTREVREIVERVRNQGKSVFCAWTGKRLNDRYDIDHCFPFAHWPNNDLWNLLPAHAQVNNTKRNRLPTADMLERAKDRILEWWGGGYASLGYSERFMTEASAALPVVTCFDSDNDLERVFAGVRNQRVRLKCYQQLAEWDGGG